METYSGFTTDTAKHLVLDAGAYYKNFIVGVDTPATAEAKLIGATQGGGEFNAIPEIRTVEVDGVKGRAKGLSILDSWDVNILANMLEIDATVIQMALASGDIDDTSSPEYDIITARNNIELSDYIDNITWVGTLSGSGIPVIIQIYNAMSGEGLAIAPTDSTEGLLPIRFLGHYDASDLQSPPFKIYYPKLAGDVTPPTVAVVPVEGASSVAVDSTIVWTFSEAIQVGSVNSTSFYLIENGTGLVVGTLTQSLDKMEITFTPASNLTASTSFTAFATTGIKDLNGNALASMEVTNFTTA